MKALVVYGTRNGATRAIAEEIGKALAEKGFETMVKDARETKGVDVNGFDLIVAGSSVWAGKWTRRMNGFLKDNVKTIESKKVALFASGLSGADPAQKEYCMKTYLESVASKHPAVKPISMGLFGGYMDFNNGGLMIKLIGGAMKKDLEKKGVDTSKPYDTRDFTAIRQWALELADKALI